MSENTVKSSESYYQEAKKMLEKKDLLGFMAKITSAILLGENDQKMLAKATFLQVKGLFKLKQNLKALELLDEAFRFNTGDQVLHLRKYEGLIRGFLGEPKKAQNIFKDILKECNNDEYLFQVENYLNLVWIYLAVEKENKNLDEAKKYLDMAKEHFNLVPNVLKRKICNNYSVYYYYKSDFEKAIEYIEEAFNYTQEKDLPKLYNNLAEIYLKYWEEKEIISQSIMDYLDKSEVLASRYDDKIEMAFSLYIRAMVQLKEGQIFSALDTLNVAFDIYTEVKAYTYSLECLIQINKISDEYKSECIKSFQAKVNGKVEKNPQLHKNQLK